MHPFRLNNYLEVRLENDKTVIYVNNNRFSQCKFLFLISHSSEKFATDINSVDEMENFLNKGLESELTSTLLGVKPEEEFWGHCSNLQAWVENNYDTRLLHSNLAFPLLKILTDLGDSRAKKVFKEEIAKRLILPYFPVIEYLIIEGYAKYLNKQELNAILKTPIKNLKNLSNSYLYEIISRSFLDDRELEFLINFERKLGFNLHPMNNEISMTSNGFNFDLKSRKIIEILIIGKRLKSIPKSLKEFRYLQKLKLGKNKLMYFPKEICQLKQIRELNLSRNKIDTIPEEISNLNFLEYLDISYNNIYKIPSIFRNLKSLKTLRLHKNAFSHFPLELCKMQSLEFLSFNAKLILNKRIEEIPKEIGNLRKLKVLRLDRNSIKFLPNSISKLSYLEELDLSRNQLEMIPSSISQLSRLKTLVLFKNPLKSLPDSLSKKEDLKIKIDNTQLNNFPDEIKEKFEKIIYKI